MKHTDFTPIIDQLRSIEKEELKQAVLAHGGLYRIDEEHRPAITFPCSDDSDTAEDVEICQVSVNDDGNLCLTGKPYGPLGDSGPEIEYNPDYLPLGMIGFIIDEIPETETIKDLSRNITINIDTVKLTDIQKIRKDACDKIKAILKKHNVEEVYASDICETCTPVIEKHPFDDNFTKTLDYISIEDNSLLFEASDCEENAYYNEDEIDTDALVSVAQWLEEREDELDVQNNE